MHEQSLSTLCSKSSIHCHIILRPQVLLCRHNQIDDAMSFDNLFLTKAEHDRAAACAKLVAVLDKDSGRHSPFNDATPRNLGDKNVFQQVLATHCQSLIRDGEPVSILLSGLRINSHTTPYDPRDPRIVIATASKFPEGDNNKIAIAQFNATRLTSPADPVTELIADHRNLGHRISFPHHVRRWTKYMRAVHMAQNPEQYASTFQNFNTYVIATSYPRILKRLNPSAAQGRNNFFTILTADPAIFSKSVHGIPMPKDLARKTFRPGSNHARYHEQLLLKIGFGPAHARALSIAPIYKTEPDRQRFQELTRYILQQLQTALERLSATMRHFRDTDDASSVRKGIETAKWWVIQLDSFRLVFDPVLEAHFTWLAQAAGVMHFGARPIWELEQRRKDSRVQMTGYSPLTAQPPPGLAPAAGTQSGDESPEPRDDEDDASRSSEDDHMQLARWFWKQQDEQYKRETQSLASGLYAPWAKTAVEYIRRICLHQTGAQRGTISRPGARTRGEMYEAALVACARVAVVEVNAACTGRVELDEALFRKLEAHQESLDPGFDVANIGRLVQQPSVSTRPHCQATLVALIALVQGAESRGRVDEVWLRTHGIRTTAQDLDIFPALRSLVFISEPCCISCESMLERMSKIERVQRPRELGLMVLDTVERRAALKAMIWQRRLMDEAASNARRAELEKVFAAGGRDARSPVSDVGTWRLGLGLGISNR